MADTKTITSEATVGLVQETRDYVNRVTDAVSETSQRWLEVGQQFVPTLQPEGFQVPNPKDLVNTYFDLAFQVLGAQKQLVEQAFDRFGALTSTNEQPAYEKAAQQATAATHQVAQAVRRNGEKAEVRV